MYRNSYLDYGHKPRHYLFGREEQLSNKWLGTDNTTNNDNKAKNYLKEFSVKELIGDQITQTINSNKDIIYFCFYCNHDIEDVERVREHVFTDHHIKMKTIKQFNKNLDKKFLIKSIDDKVSDNISENEKEESIRHELDSIPDDQKDYFVRRGIRLMDAIGENAFYCKICEKPISSLTLIYSHLEAEQHLRCENRKTLKNLIRSGKHSTPIVGLQFIIEYKNNSMNEIIYECSFCQVFKNADQMYSHLFEFKHRINILKNLENKDFENSSELEIDLKLIEWQQKLGMGFVTQTKEMPKFNGNCCDSSLEQLRAIFGSFRPKSIDLIETLFSVRINSESDAKKVIEIIEAIKEASIKYYSHKNGQNSS